MKILWLVNGVMSEYSLLTNQRISPYGGWLDSCAKRLSETNNIELSIIIPDTSYDNLYSVYEGEKIKYYPIPDISKWKLNKAEKILSEIINKEEPDIIDIHGTENFHAFVMAYTSKKLGIPFVVTIQGIVSAISEHMFVGLPFRVIYGYSFRDMMRGNLVKDLSKKFKKFSRYELKTVKITNNVIGRTTFDKSVTKIINNSVNYYHCNESLRESFYNNKWEYERCKKRTIFLSQANYPIKGAHIAFRAIAIVSKIYPNIQVIIAGKDITNKKKIKDKLKLSYYGKYLNRLQKKMGLNNKITFIGEVDENEMLNQYLSCNVFICPSTVENSPNSLGEALLLGVPTISSYVGGIPDFVNNEVNGLLYPVDAYYMLAYQILRVFEDKNLVYSISNNSRKEALLVHDRKNNVEAVLNIYNRILATEKRVVHG